MSVSDNAVSVPAGTYLVSYTVNTSSDTSNILRVALAVNGSVIQTEEILVSAGNGELETLSKTIILTVGDTTTLSIVNTTEGEISVTNAGLAVVKLQ